MMAYLQYGLSFNGFHSLKDYGLFLAEAPDFGTPEPKRYTVDIPGRDGILDYTTSATGEVKFNNREMTFTFATMIAPEFREALRSRLWSDLNGREVTVVYDLDSDWYYTGVASVAFEDVKSWKMKVVITVDAFPYKLQDGQTIITVSPDSFGAEQIFLGKGTAAQNINSIFTFGTKSNPQLDLTQFTKLTFQWQDDTPWGTPSLQIVDGNGDTFNTTLYNTRSASQIAQTGYYGMDLSISNITSIDTDSVYRILCQGRKFVELYGTTLASATTIVTVDRMSVVPVWSASAAVTAFVNGRKIALPAGASKDYSIQLHEGENQVSFVSDADETTIEISFQNGRL